MIWNVLKSVQKVHTVRNPLHAETSKSISTANKVTGFKTTGDVDKRRLQKRSRY